MLSPTASAPFDAVVAPIVYAAAEPVVAGEGDAVTLARVVDDVTVYFDDVTGASVESTRSVSV